MRQHLRKPPWKAGEPLSSIQRAAHQPPVSHQSPVRHRSPRREADEPSQLDGPPDWTADLAPVDNKAFEERIRPPRPILSFLLHVQPAEPVHAQRQRDLTTVVYVVLGDVPDDVAAVAPRAFALGVGPRTLKARRQVGFSPPGQ